MFSWWLERQFKRHCRFDPLASLSLCISACISLLRLEYLYSADAQGPEPFEIHQEDYLTPDPGSRDVRGVLRSYFL